MLCKSPPKHWIESLCHSGMACVLTTLETPDVNGEFYKIKGMLWPWEFIGSFCFSSPEVIILFVAVNAGCFRKKCSMKLSIRHLLFEKKKRSSSLNITLCQKSAYSLYPRDSKMSWAELAIRALEKAKKPARHVSCVQHKCKEPKSASKLASLTPTSGKVPV